MELNKISTQELNNNLNRNKFKLLFREIKNTEFLCNQANVPGLSASSLEIPNQFNKIYVQGKKLNYDQLTINFIVDENMNSYKEIYAWMLGIYSPMQFAQFVQFQNDLNLPKFIKGNRIGFDASLITLTNANNINLELNFVHLFPVNLSSIDFGLDQTSEVTATATFQYDYYTFK